MERRRFVRYTLVGMLPEIEGTKGKLNLIGVDVCRNGLGVTCSEDIDVGESLKAKFTSKEIELKVVWTKAMVGGLTGETIYRCGLRGKDVMSLIENTPKLLVCKDL